MEEEWKEGEGRRRGGDNIYTWFDTWWPGCQARESKGELRFCTGALVQWRRHLAPCLPLGFWTDLRQLPVSKEGPVWLMGKTSLGLFLPGVWD